MGPRALPLGTPPMWKGHTRTRFTPPASRLRKACSPAVALPSGSVALSCHRSPGNCAAWMPPLNGLRNCCPLRTSWKVADWGIQRSGQS